MIVAIWYMPRPGDEDGAEVAVANHPVEVGVDEVETGNRPEMAEQTGLDVLRTKRLLEERVVGEVDLADAQEVGGTPEGVDPFQPAVVEANVRLSRRRRHASNRLGRGARKPLRPTEPRVERGRVPTANRIGR